MQHLGIFKPHALGAGFKQPGVGVGKLGVILDGFRGKPDLLGIGFVSMNHVSTAYRNGWLLSFFGGKPHESFFIIHDNITFDLQLGGINDGEARIAGADDDVVFNR